MDTKRKIAPEKINTFNAKYNIQIDINDLNYMKDNDSYLDPAKATNWIDAAAAETITMDPRKQSYDENRQINLLQNTFNGVQKVIRSTKFIHNGQFYSDKSYITAPDPHDIDAILEEQEYTICFSLKGGQNQDGGSQNNIFREMNSLILHAPELLGKIKLILVLFVDGCFWTRSNRKIFLGFNKYLGKDQFSLIDILKHTAQDKKCIILTSNDLPQVQSSFYEVFIKGTKYE